MTRSSIAALAVWMVLPPMAQAGVIWEANPSRGMDVFEGLERAPGIIDIQNDPKGLHGRVYHFNIFDKPEGGKERCEAKGCRLTDGSNYRLTRGNTYWIGWRSMYGEGVAQGQAWVAVFQMHAYGGEGMGAPFVLRTLSDRMLHLQNNVMGTNIHIWNAPLITNKWQSFVIRAHMDHRADVGWIEFWYNGIQQTFINGQKRYYCPTHENEEGTYNRLKWGLYRGGANSGNWHAWMSGARIGTTFADVDPDGGTAPTPTPTPGPTPEPTPTPGVTPTPTATPTPGRAIALEAETMAFTHSGTGTTLQTDANASGGRWVSLDAENAGSWLELTTPNVPAGTYTLRMSYKSNNNRGQATLKVDGTPVGGSLDQYGTPPGYPTHTWGTVTFGASGSHKLRLTVAGKRAASGNYVLSADKFTLE
jgi:hypothetical protein